MIVLRMLWGIIRVLLKIVFGILLLPLTLFEYMVAFAGGVFSIFTYFIGGFLLISGFFILILGLGVSPWMGVVAIIGGSLFAVLPELLGGFIINLIEGFKGLVYRL